MADVRLRSIQRPSDMAPDAALVVLQETDGDVIVCVTNNGGREQTEVQFCASGGKSPNTRRALIALMKAMQADLDGIIPELEFGDISRLIADAGRNTTATTD